MRKLYPGIQPRNGMNFPNGAACGNCVPESCLRMGCVFRWPAVWKVHPSLSVYSGMRFPLKDSTGKHDPFRDLIPGHAFRWARHPESASRFERPGWDALSVGMAVGKTRPR